MIKALEPIPNSKRARLFKTISHAMFPIASTIFFSSLFAFTNPVFAQQQKIDSLLAVLQTTKADTIRVKLLHNISIEYLSTKANRAIEYAKKGLALSEKIAFKEGQSVCLNALGRAYNLVGKYDTAMTCYEKRYIIVKELKDSIGIAAVYLNKGGIFFRYGEHKKAIDLYEKANRIYSSRNEKGLLAKGYHNIGGIYLVKAEYQIALKYLLMACKLYEEEKNEKDICLSFIGISNIYMNLKQYDKAIQYALDAKAKYSKANNFVGVGTALYTLSLVYDKENDFENKVKYLNEAKTFFDETQSIYYQTIINQALGFTYLKHGEKERALDYFNLALPIAQKIGDRQMILALYGSIGMTYSDKGDFPKALKYLCKAEKLIKEIKANLSGLEISENFIVLYARMNQPDSVKKYLERYKQLQDTIFNEKSTKAIAEMQTKYETEKKDKEILTLNLETQKKKNTIWAIESGFVLLLLFSGSGFVVSRNKKKREQAVLSQMASESDMKALRSQMNPHFIFNCIDTINGLLNELKVQESKTCLDKFSNLTRSVLENSKKREIPLSDELETLRLYMDLENMRFTNPFQYFFGIEPGIDPETTLIPPLILQPFVENSIKHGFRNLEKTGKLTITICSENEFLICTVEDNGVGRGNTINIKSVSGFKKESLGVKLTEERLHLISKTKKVKSHFSISDLVDANNNPAGTLVEIYLPYELSI